MLKLITILLLLVTAYCQANGFMCSDVVPDSSRYQCASDEKVRSEAGLIAAYADALQRTRHSSASKKHLKRAQAAWQEYRDNHCRFSTSAIEAKPEQIFEQDTCISTRNKIRMYELRPVNSQSGL